MMVTHDERNAEFAVALNWAKSDIEQRFGFSGQRFTE